MKKAVPQILCPTCQKRSDYSSENPNRPFCCERCKLIDLGAWAAENYKIPTNENAPILIDPSHQE